ncbi:MAG: methylase of chemotaxis methyl-accepting protein [Edaphobacter sp.]|nr:methylase of chemotaxis methyl-accepting protein [Edaphobacter sp.]
MSPRKPLPKKLSFPIVGIGASAGGLEAFSQLLPGLPADTGMAFVIVQHLDASSAGSLPGKLPRFSKLPVYEVTDGMEVRHDRIYVIPARASMTLRGKFLQLKPRATVGQQPLPIDLFFHSLAEELGNQAIGVVLSGTASDGTDGCRAINAAGGFTFAQDETSAKFTRMPPSAVASGAIDFVLSPEGIARELVRIGKHPFVSEVAHDLLSLGDDADLVELLSLVRAASGVDFEHYKQTTLKRRIKRRMVVHRVETLKEYLRYIKADPAELNELYRDILINVTGFFRDKEAFEALGQDIFPSLLQERKVNEVPIRIWVPGCSTGEEVYSLAIVLLECLWEKTRKSPIGAMISKGVQIFATDVSEIALDGARIGLYSESAVADVSKKRRANFFQAVDGGYQISKLIREMCVFAKQNVTKDPPFSNIDLISCRNLLIYLGPALQKRVIPTLHYALKPNGYLLLGGSESLGAFSDHFTLINKKQKIYQKKSIAARLITYFGGPDYAIRKPEAKAERIGEAALSVERNVERVLLNRFVPASIVVNEQMEIVQFRGRTGAYLEPASASPTFSLSKMAREGLLIDLRAALNKARKNNAVVRKEGVFIRSNWDTKEVNLDVIPVQGQTLHERVYVVVFQDAAPAPPPDFTGEHKIKKALHKQNFLAPENARLTQEVAQLRDQLQLLIEDYETTTEEFKSANEEVLSANEELQSTNEELETAKEELQSSNEELTTLNEELQNRNIELSVANNDLTNLLGNVNIPVVMVGNDLRIRRFTPPAQKLLNLIPADIGRRVGEIRPNLDFDKLEQIVRETLDTATLQQREVHEQESGRSYLLRVRPYKTWDNKIDGAVISFQDVDSLKRTLDQTRLYADALIENAREPMLILDGGLRVTTANGAFYKAFHVSREETEDRLIYELGNGQWNVPRLRSLFDNISQNNSRIDDFEVEHEFLRLGRRIMILNARRVEPQSGRQLIVLSIADMTEQKSKGPRGS